MSRRKPTGPGATTPAPARSPSPGKRPAEPAPLPAPTIPDRSARDLSQVARLLGDETRLRILFYLARAGELHVADLCGKLDQAQPAVSHHLALLRVSSLIESRREGKHNFYRVRAGTFGELLAALLTSIGPMAPEIRFGDFVIRQSNK